MEDLINAISNVEFSLNKGFNQLSTKQKQWVIVMMNGIKRADFEKYISKDKFISLMDADVSNIHAADDSRMWKDVSYMNHVFVDCAISFVLWEKLHKENTNKARNLGIFYLEMTDTVSLRPIDVMKLYDALSIKND